LDQVLDSILTETARDAKAKIADKLATAGTQRQVVLCTGQDAAIDALLVRFQ